ncbi:MAG: hypothetical protein WD009_14300 [Phycisphaeraceae bacterium]
MTMRTLLGTILVPLVLLFAAIAISSLQLWSHLANVSLPWLLSALAVAMLILAGTCALLQCEPAAIPTRAAAGVIITVLTIFAIALVVDIFFYTAGPSPEQWANAAEWLGFAVLLIATFTLPHTARTL